VSRHDSCPVIDQTKGFLITLRGVSADAAFVVRAI
jgi:hypothetical protein